METMNNTGFGGQYFSCNIIVRYSIICLDGFQTSLFYKLDLANYSVVILSIPCILKIILRSQLPRIMYRYSESCQV